MNIQKNKFTLSPEDRIVILALSLIKGFGPRAFIKLISRFKSISDILSSNLNNLEQILSIEIAKAIGLKEFLKNIDKYILKLKNSGISYVTVLDNDYPQLLREIYDPPVVLYIKGDFSREDFINCFSVVGTRKCTYCGVESTKLFVHDLVIKGFTIVSGMAFGIDTAVHKSAIICKGRTIAVLSSSVNVPSPLANADIYNKILKNGCVISECPLNHAISPGMFPLRNRIIAGISKGTLVTEAGQKSGALITAKLALEYGREVFAVPTSIYNQRGVGTNSLIKRGEAKLVQDGSDIFDEFNISNLRGEIKKKLDKSEQNVYDILKAGPNSIDYITKILKKDVSEVSKIISFMEIDGIIGKVEGNMYVVLK